MNRSDLIKAVAADGYYGVNDVDEIMRSVENVIIKTLSKGEDIKLFSGLVLRSILVPEHEFRDPKTNTIKIANEHKICRLYTTRRFKEKINK